MRSIVRRLLQAQDADAIGAPENIEIAGYAEADSVLIAVRELKVDPQTSAYRRHSRLIWSRLGT